MNEKVENILKEMREEFRGKSFEEIQSITWINRDPIKLGWRKLYPAIWSQEYGDSEILLVVQLTSWYIRNIFGSTDCMGFLINNQGSTTDVDAYWLMHEVGHP